MKDKVESIIIVFSLWFAAFSSLYSDTLNSIALYIVLPIAFMVSFEKNKYSFETNKYMKLLIFLYLWFLLACLWAFDVDLALRQMRQLLGTFLLSFIFAVNAKDKKMIPWLYFTYIILFLSAWWYAETHILINIDDDRFRLNDDKLNANTMAYYLFYSTFLSYILGEILNSRNLKRIWKLLFLSLIPISFITALLTASRQVLIIQVPLILLLLYLRYLKGYKPWRKVLFLIISLVVLSMFYPSLIEHYQDSYLAERNSISVKDDSRAQLFYEAINIGLEYFPLGVGPGNLVNFTQKGYFSHNTYTELWANVGIVGVYLYCWIILLFIKRQWRKYKRTNETLCLAFLFFGIIYFVDGFFYVFYKGVWLFSFFILVSSHSENICLLKRKL